MLRLDLELVRHALHTARRHGFKEVELRAGEDFFHARLAPGQPPKEAVQLEAPNDFLMITSNAVGYFHHGAVRMAVGHEVKKGDNVGVVEALGIANDVESKWDGTIEEVLVESGQAVEFGQPLASLREV